MHATFGTDSTNLPSLCVSCMGTLICLVDGQYVHRFIGAALVAHMVCRNL
jgi:hypothetical protein